ncbi:MAG: hypothetical protein NTV97_23675 [Alphaproteobacteria bacterium]|nr:hypothetical protein [Alphaproteobacteria bacterium]
MKNFSGAVQGLIATALIGFGVLCGLAVAVLVHGLDIGGVAPLFANALGAAIGAGITLWFSEHRAERATERQHLADMRKVRSDLVTIIVNLRIVTSEIAQFDITGRSATSLHVLRQTLARQSNILAVLATANLIEEYSRLVLALGHAERVVSEMQPLSHQALMMYVRAAGDALPEALTEVSESISIALPKLL